MNDTVKSALLVLVTLISAVNLYLLVDLKSDRKNTIVDPLASAPETGAPAGDGHNHGNDGHIVKPNEAAPVPAGPSTTVSFTKTSHDFGKIKQDTENKYTFKFTNTGNEPLIIQSAVGSCGCTVPDYPKDPIPPGQSGEIKVVYSPGKQQGMQNKTVTVTANTEPATTTLQIMANVEPAE